MIRTEKIFTIYWYNNLFHMTRGGVRLSLRASGFRELKQFSFSIVPHRSRAEKIKTREKMDSIISETSQRHDLMKGGVAEKIVNSTPNAYMHNHLLTFLFFNQKSKSQKCQYNSQKSHLRLNN